MTTTATLTYLTPNLMITKIENYEYYDGYYDYDDDDYGLDHYSSSYDE